MYVSQSPPRGVEVGVAPRVLKFDGGRRHAQGHAVDADTETNEKKTMY